MKKLLKALLKRLHLFEPAVRVQTRLRSLRFLPGNWHYWRNGAPDGVAIPPLDLIVLVAGVPDISWFLEGGKRAADSIRTTLESNGANPERLRNVLDFGCGCGRVLRHLRPLGWNLHGVDVNPSLIAWSRNRLPFARTDINGFRPPAVFADDTFDLIYALSVFTHMPEDAQLEWMEELRRLLKPGGYLLITTHGERYLDQLNDTERDRFAQGNVVVRVHGEEGSNRFGAYHPVSYLKNTLARGFDFVDHRPEAAWGNPYQDVVLLRKPL